MSRFSDYYDDESPITYEMWEWNLMRALGSPRGQRALTDLRDALNALPEKRLIARALCTVGEGRRPDENLGHGLPAREFDELIEEQGAGVCAVGAFAWYRKVKAGLDEVAAFAALPTLDDYNHDVWETAAVGAEAGLARTLAEHLAYMNDEEWLGCTPEERWQLCMDWIEKQTAPAPSESLCVAAASVPAPAAAASTLNDKEN